MRKKYEKPELMVEVMSIDMLQMLCSHHPSSVAGRKITSTCPCCSGGTNYPFNSHF